MTPLQSARLAPLGWVEHGFGTRADGAWTPLERTAKLRQVHGNAAVTVSEPGHHGDGDALITAAEQVWLEIRTADCVPILLADPVRRVVAAIHAGWRGTAVGIAGLTVAKMTQEYGCRAEDVIGAIGPSIGGCCFAVGEDVAAHFRGHIVRLLPQPYVDLVSANRQQLVLSGMAPGQIETTGLCTACKPEQFHSFRRDHGEGRMISAIQIRMGT